MSSKKRKTTPSQRSQRHGNSPSRSQRPKASKPKTALAIVAALFLGSCSLELVACRMGGIVLVATAVFSVVSILLSAINNQLFKQDRRDEQPEDDDGFLDRIGIGLRNLGWRLWRKPACLLVCVVAAYLLMCTTFAAAHVGGRILHACGNAIELISYDAAETPSSSVDVSTDHTLTTPSAERAPGSDDEPTPSMYVDLTEPGRVLSLSGERCNELYYLAGIYAVENWEDDEAISAAVRAHIVALVEERREDFLISSADPMIQAEIDQASVEERAMQTSQDLDVVIARREEAFEKCPFAGMANLIAENYNGYGLAYYQIHGNAKTVEYYWGTSILWLQKCLTFSSVSDDIPSILNRIGTRYHDLAQNQPFGSEEQIRASKLSDAYVSLARSY